MLQKMMAFVQQNKMIAPGDHVVCGCSGGADSVCLLLLLQECAKILDFSLSAVHVEHGIRGIESQQDQRFVEKLCDSYHIPLHICKVDVLGYAKEKKMGTEEAARILRYEQFQNVGGNGHTKIALAHHLEDQAETVLFQMLRGSGLSGLTGISPVRFDGEICYIRPLLTMTRAEIEQYLAQKGQDYCTDATNLDESYSRNKIRRRLMPLLSEINEQAVLHIGNSAQKIEEAYEFILENAKERYQALVTEKGDEISIRADALNGLHPAVRSELVRQMLFTLAKKQKDISSVHVEEILALTVKQSGKKIMLPYGMLAYMQYGCLTIHKKKEKINENPLLFEVTKESLASLEEGVEAKLLWNGEHGEKLFGRLICSEKPLEEIEKKAYTKQFDYDKIKDGFFVRNRHSGDYFAIGEQMHHKKLSDYLINEKIPATQRDSILLLAKGKEIIWMIGGRMSESFKVSEHTKRIIEIQFYGGTSDGLFSKP